MAYPKPITADHHVSSPRAFRQQGVAPTGVIEPYGQVMAVPFSSTVQVVDLEAIVNPPYNNLGNLQYNQTAKGVCGNFVSIMPEGADLYIAVGATGPHVAGVSPATKGSITGSGTYVGATAAAWRVPAGTEFKFIPHPGLDRVMGIVASGGATGTMRLYTSNPVNGGSLT